MSFQMQKRTVWTIFCQENETNKLQVAQESIVFEIALRGPTAQQEEGAPWTAGAVPTAHSNFIDL